MKKSLFIFLCFLYAATAIKAQAPCESVTADAFAGDQSGAHNYFGVRVTLAQAYSQDVTVTGYIHKDADENGNTDHPFTLTITAGSLTAETAANFYETDPTGGAAVTVASVSPCPHAETPLETLNKSGQLHNDYQEYLLSYIVSQNLNLRDTNNLKQVIHLKTNEFFQSRGINISNQTFPTNFAPYLGSNVIQFSSSDYSSAGIGILNDLRTLIINYDEFNEAIFFTSLNSLQQRALNLSNPIEVYTVGEPVSIAIYSFTYWKNNANRWIDILNYQVSVRNSANPVAQNWSYENNTSQYSFKKVSGPNSPDNFLFNYRNKSNTPKATCKIKLVHLGAADVGGAIGGAEVGIGGGPAGAAAGAILGSSGASLYNILDQAMSCLFDWW